MNASEQTPTKKSGWSWPVLRAIGIVKNQKTAENPIVFTVQGLTKNLSDNSLRKSIADEGFDPADDHETVTSTPTQSDKFQSEKSTHSTPRSTSPTTALQVLDPHTIATTATHSPLRSSALLEAIMITDNHTTSSTSWSPSPSQSMNNQAESTTITSPRLDTVTVQKKLQELPPFKKNPQPPKKSSLIHKIFLDGLDDAFSDSETDGGQLTPVDNAKNNNSNKLMQKNGFAKNFIDLEKGEKLSSPVSDIITKKEPESSSICSNLASLCGSCFKKKNYKQ